MVCFYAVDTGLQADSMSDIRRGPVFRIKKHRIADPQFLSASTCLRSGIKSALSHSDGLFATIDSELTLGRKMFGCGSNSVRNAVNQRDFSRREIHFAE